MQRLSRDQRDGDEPFSTRIERRMSCDVMVGSRDGGDGDKMIRRFEQSQNVEISAGHGFQTQAQLDESGEFENALKEWTVHFLEKDQPTYCPIETLKKLEIKIGNNYGIKFLYQSKNIHARVHNVESDGEKSLTFTVGNELMLLCRIIGCPEERSPNSDDDAIYEGDFKSLLTMLKREQMLGASISFGCVIFKDFLLKTSRGRNHEEEKSNWETFA